MIGGYLVGDTEVIKRLSAMPEKLRFRLGTAITRLSIDLQSKVKGDKLSGQVLHRRTGTLSRSISRVVLTETNSVVGVVSTNVKYGIAWERGFDRKVGAGARGGPKTLLGAARDAYFAKHPSGTKHYAARSFLRSSLAEMRPEISEKIGIAVNESIR